METVNCLLCGSENHHKIYDLTDRDEKIVQCDDCGFVYKNPRLSREDLSEIFEEHPGNEEESYLERKKGDYIRYLDEIERVIKKKGKLLDIGASYGYFLNFARKRGWEVYGVEACEPEVKYAKSKLSIDLVQGDLKDAQFDNESFDVITLFEVLEHIPYPMEILKEVYRILKPKGILCIVVPNVKNPKTEKYDFQNIFHLSHFSDESLRKMTTICNFEVIKTLINPVFPFSHDGKLRRFSTYYGRPIIRVIRQLLSTSSGKKLLSTGMVPQGGITLLATKNTEQE